MPVARIQIEKQGALSYLSHLDYVEALQRALRRSGLPAAYSLGFNPHMKVAFGAALAVGVTSEGEWADIELTQCIDVDEFTNQLNRSLPVGMKIKDALIYEEKPKAISNMIEWASYIAEWNASEDQLSRLEVILDQLKKEEEILIEVVSPKKTKIMDLKKELLYTKLIYDEAQGIQLYFDLRLTPLGSLKPNFFLEYLEKKGFLTFSDAKIIRTGLWRDSKENKKNPIE